METPERNGFPSPFEVEIPAACEEWEEMYAYHVLFDEQRRPSDAERFWFQDALHAPEPFPPFDCVWFDYGVPAMNQVNARLLVLPPSLDTEYRVLNGYVYLSANAVTDPEELARRADSARDCGPRRPRPSSGGSAGAGRRRRSSRRPSGGSPNWPPADAATGRSPPSSTWVSRPSRRTFPASIASSGSAREAP